MQKKHRINRIKLSELNNKYLNKISAYITKATSIFAIVVGSLVIVGWFFDIPALKSVLSRSVTLKFNTALCFILSAISLLLLNRQALSNAGKKLFFLCTGIILLIAGITLTEYFTGWNAGIDELLWTEGPGAIATSAPGRMSLSTAINFTLLSLIFLSLRNKRYHLLAQVVLLFVVAGSLLVILNHSFGSSFLNSIPQLSNTALHTAILFIVFSTGIMFSTSLQYLKFAFQNKITGFFVLTILILVFVFYAMNKNIADSENTAYQVEHTNLVLLETEKVFSEAKDIESAIWSFVITGNEDYLALFTSTVLLINGSIEKLKNLAQDNPRQQTRIDSLQQFVIRSIAIRQSMIDSFRVNGYEGAKKIILKGEGRKVSNLIRKIINAVHQEEEGLLATRKEENKKSQANSARVIAIFQVIAALLFALVFLIIFNNTRQRNKAEKEMNAAQKRFGTIFNVIPVAISVTRIEDGLFLYANEAFCKQLGFRKEELIGKKSTELNIIDAEVRKSIPAAIEQSSGGAKNLELKIRKANGELMDIFYSVEKIEIDNEICYATALVDITERKKAEEALKASLTEISNFKTLFESAPGLYLILRPDFTIEAVSDEYLKATMTRREAILGRGLFEVFPDNPDDPGADGVTNLKASLHFVLANKVAHAMANQKYDIARPDGSFEERTWAPLNKPVLDVNGKIVYIIHSVEDITVRLRNEKELLRKTNKIKDLYNNAPCGYHSVDAKGVFTEINDTELQWLGYTSEEVVGKLSFYDILTPASKSFFRESFPVFKEKGFLSDVEYEIQRKDGSILPVMINATVVYDEAGNYLHSRSTVIDYTEQKKLNEELRKFNRDLEQKVEEKTKEVIKKEQQYRFLLQNMREGIQVISHDWRYLFVNNSVVKQSKYLREELLGHTMMEKYPGIENTEMFKTFQHCMEERISHTMENEFTFPDGSKEWFELSIQPVSEGLFILSMDITERKKAEEVIILLNEDLKKRVEDLAASNIELERFAYVASHDLQEPLRMVSSFLGLLKKRYYEQVDETGRSYIRFAVDGAARMKKLILDLLQFSRVDSNKETMHPVDCNQLVDEVQQDLLAVITEKKAILKTDPLPVVTGYKSQLQQLFQNLISNAIKYRNEKPPHIEISSRETATHWEFCVKDNGQGIDPKYFEKIFIIFQRLHNKDEHSGTGIGLAIAKKITERHGGKIWVESEPGKGSSFYFTIVKK